MSFFKKLFKKPKQEEKKPDARAKQMEKRQKEPGKQKIDQEEKTPKVKSTEPRKRVVVLGLDGTPFTFMNRLLEEGKMPNFKALLEKGDYKQMRSVYPTISSVAWSSYTTGVNPAKHGIFGFIDLSKGSYDMDLPLATSRKVPSLWKILSKAGKKVVVLNVPVTFPPEEVNGVLVSGFLATKVDKAVYPKEMTDYFRKLDYRTDVDSRKAREDLDFFVQDLNHGFEKRVEAMYHLMETQDWDYLHTHIMGTDRLFHFLWKHMEQEKEPYHQHFMDFLKKVDDMLGELVAKLDEDTELVILSDHGFCGITANFQLNRWLVEQGYLVLEKEDARSLNDISTETKAFSLIPGRIFINRKGAFPKGSVEDEDYETLRDELSEKLLEIVHPKTGKPVIQKVFRKEEVYSGPLLERAADLIAHPHDGFDIKGKLAAGEMYHDDAINGMHTYHDAFLYIRGKEIGRDDFEITDVTPTVLKLFDIEVPEYMDGKSLL